MLAPRTLYARIVISKEEIERAVARDKALTSRMAAARLSPKHAKKAWRRIRSARWTAVIVKELQAFAEDLRWRGSNPRGV